MTLLASDWHIQGRGSMVQAAGLATLVVTEVGRGAPYVTSIPRSRASSPLPGDRPLGERGDGECRVDRQRARHGGTVGHEDAGVPAQLVPVGTELWFQPWFVRDPHLGPNAARLVVRAP